MQKLCREGFILVATANANESMRDNIKVEQKSKRDYNQDNQFKSKKNVGNSPYKNTYSLKDEEEDNLTFGHKSGEGRKRSNSKDLGEQSDKLEMLKRLEREKKALQRKLREDDFERPRKAQSKAKRMSNKNYWTVNYLNGLDDDYDEYYDS